MIKVYSTPMCPLCDKTKDYLRRKEVEFLEFNVKEDEKAKEEMIEKTQQKGVPVLDINGTIILGFDRKTIDKALDL